MPNRKEHNRSLEDSQLAGQARTWRPVFTAHPLFHSAPSVHTHLIHSPIIFAVRNPFAPEMHDPRACVPSRRQMQTCRNATGAGFAGSMPHMGPKSIPPRSLSSKTCVLSATLVLVLCPEHPVLSNHSPAPAFCQTANETLTSWLGPWPPVYSLRGVNSAEGGFPWPAHAQLARWERPRRKSHRTTQRHTQAARSAAVYGRASA